MRDSSIATQSWVRRELSLFSTLVRSMPKLVIVLFSCAVIMMNLLSNFIVVSLPYLALNAGIFVSWIAFLLLDIVAKHYGPRAANRLSIIAILANSFAVLVFFLISQLGTVPELDMILHGQWSILLASTIAFIVSAFANNFLNWSVGKLFRKNPDGKLAFATRSYVSTFLGQCIDNFVFASLAFVVFPHIPGASQVTLEIAQVIGASVLCALIEFALEIVFSPIGYRVTKAWKEKGVGSEYIQRYYPENAVESKA